MAFGIDGIDRMLGGGVTAGTATLVAGTLGVGKTLLALHFAAEAARFDELVLFLGFVESAAQLHQQASAFGLDLAAAEAAGSLRLLVLPAFDLEADRVAQLIVQDVEGRQVKRLVIDSLTELDGGIGDTERRASFFAALVTYLRARRVTTYTTLDIPSIAGPELNLANTPLSLLAENLLLLRTVEYRGALHRGGVCAQDAFLGPRASDLRVRRRHWPRHSRPWSGAARRRTADRCRSTALRQTRSHR